MGLTEVKGISQKRFERLKAIGIDSVKKLAEKLGVSGNIFQMDRECK